MAMLLGDAAREQLHLLRHDADLAAIADRREPGEIVPVEAHAPGVGHFQAQQDADQRAFPGSRRPGDAQHRARRRPRGRPRPAPPAWRPDSETSPARPRTRPWRLRLGAGQPAAGLAALGAAARRGGRRPRAPAGTGSRRAAICRIGASARADRIEAATITPTVMSPATIMPGTEIDQDQCRQCAAGPAPRLPARWPMRPGLQPGPGAADQMALEPPLHVRLERPAHLTVSAWVTASPRTVALAAAAARACAPIGRLHCAGPTHRQRGETPASAAAVTNASTGRIERRTAPRRTGRRTPDRRSAAADDR